MPTRPTMHVLGCTRLPAALHAEWTKFRTVPGPSAALQAMVMSTIGLSAAAAAASTCGAPTCPQDPVRISLTGVSLGQALVVVFAVQLLGAEFGTGMIGTTLAAIPGRRTVMLAKATLLTAVVLATGIVATVGSWLTGRILLLGTGFIAENGSALPGLSDGPTLRAVAGSALYLVLVGLLSVGVAAAVRDSAVTIGTVLAVLYLFPVVITMVSNPDWHRFLQQIAPMNAGLAIQNTVDLGSAPIGPWAGLGVLSCWAAAGLLLGGLLLGRRDV
ncbi:MAG: hypothetical protein WKF57_09895 [Nakamurella sp.]